MPKAKPEDRERARELRRLGWSYKKIVEELGVSKSSVSLWVRDIELTPEQIENNKVIVRVFGDANKGAQHNRCVALEQRRAYQQAGREKAKEMSKLHIIGCMLYWAEGTKQRNTLEFVNADPHMMSVFVRFLREELSVADADFKLRVHVHNADRVVETENYWLELLRLPREVLIKTYVKKGSKTRQNRLENGVCGVRVESTEIVHHIFGAIQEYGDFENEEWLF